ncbi:MAG TPA: 50S ribosomal protein L21 [Solirubrobacteraceae bacterium]|nr:50S ribosomal protein L21 [Solirubrobacteraceae bacterium]
MYAIVKTGGKQYRVEQGQSLLVERLPASAEGDTVALRPLLYVDGDKLVDGDALSRVTVSARVVAHERGPKLRIVKFKPKRGYKRRTGHRQDLTRLEVTSIKVGAARRAAASAPGGDEAAGGAAAAPPVRAPAAKVADAPAAKSAKPADAEAKPRRAAAAGKAKAAEAEAAEAKPAKPAKPRRTPSTPKPKDDDGS